MHTNNKHRNQIGMGADSHKSQQRSLTINTWTEVKLCPLSHFFHAGDSLD
jgi:hypothetical protein